MDNGFIAGHPSKNCVNPSTTKLSAIVFVLLIHNNVEKFLVTGNISICGPLREELQF